MQILSEAASAKIKQNYKELEETCKYSIGPLKLGKPDGRGERKYTASLDVDNTRNACSFTNIEFKDDNMTVVGIDHAGNYMEQFSANSSDELVKQIHKEFTRQKRHASYYSRS